MPSYETYAVVLLDQPDTPDEHPVHCIAGIPDSDTAVQTVNDWITQTIKHHNADPVNKSDPCKYYADLIGENQDVQDAPGYIFYIEDGKRQNVAKFVITNGFVYDRDKFLPNLGQLV